MKYELWNLLNENKSNALAKYLLERPDDFEFTESNLTSQTTILSIYECFKNETPDEYIKRKPEYVFSFIKDADLRIDYLKLSWFRGIPYPENTLGKKTKADAYGISFGNLRSKSVFNIHNPKSLVHDLVPKTCSSLVLLGSNGSGKTSIYSAIELLCTGDLAIERKHKPKDILEFRHYNGNTDQPFRLELNLKDKTIQRLKLSGDEKQMAHKNLWNAMDLSPFFCSESDLSIFECSGKDVNEYIKEVCGLTELINVVTLCRSFTDIWEDSKEDVNTKVKVTVSNDSSQEHREDNIQSQNSTDDLYSNVPQDIKMQVANLAVPLIKILEDEISRIQKTILVSAQRALKELFSPLIDKEDDVELSCRRYNGLEYFDGKIKILSQNKTLDPRAFYNNFRFKMYLICLRIGVAFYIMKERKIKFPLLFDDIFNSSDFKNRISTKEFFQNIMSVYASEGISDSLLQIIFFTQDEIIAESVYSGIHQVSNESLKEGCKNLTEESGNVVLGRIFSPYNWEPYDEVSVFNRDTKITSFINLYSPIKEQKYYMYEKK